MVEIRAAKLKEDLMALVALGSDRASRILADLPARELRRIDRASAVDWIPVEVFLELCRIIHASAGDPGVRAWGRAATGRAAEASPYRPIIAASIQVLGLSAATLLRLAPPLWRSTFRKAGRLTVTLTPPHAALVRLVGLPAPMRQRPFLLSVAGGLEAAFELAGRPGTIQFVEPLEEEPRFIATWPEA
jgi:hypothetical protein